MASFSPSEKCYAAGIYPEQERTMDKQFTASEVRESAIAVVARDMEYEAEMLQAYADLLEADEGAVPVAVVKDSDALYTGWLSWTGEPAPPETKLYTHPASADAGRLAEALRFYADGNHLLLGDPGAWDTVSGEPQNWLCDEAGTATIEDGTIAKQALAAHHAQAQPPAARVPDWTDAQCMAFMAVGLRHTEYKKGKSPTVEEIRQGAKAALAAQENPNG